MKKNNMIFQTAVYLFFALLSFITLFPFLNTLAMSLSSSRAIVSGEVVLWPKEFNLQAYQNLIENGMLFHAMRNTVVVTVVGTALNMVFTICAAYVVSKKRLLGKKLFLWMMLFTMMFSGGMIPAFLLVKNLGMMNTYWSLWLPPLISVYNMIILKSFFENIPGSLEEAAAIDGANDIYILVRIVLPLSKAVLATIGLFYAVAYWNNYRDVLIYITPSEKKTLMVVLMQMQNNMSEALQYSGEGTVGEQALTPEAVKAASTVVAVLPIMCVYPFLQKYFVKGVMIGSVKG